MLRDKMKLTDTKERIMHSLTTYVNPSILWPKELFYPTVVLEPVV